MTVKALLQQKCKYLKRFDTETKLSAQAEEQRRI
jgi:hypothetical protein